MANVLIVEDEPALARLLSASLSFAGHSLRVANTLTEALDTIREGWPQVVTLDLQLGADDGSEVFLEARRIGTQARFVIVSALGAREAFYRLGADAWVAKPFDPWVVEMKVQELADAGLETPEKPETSLQA